MLNAQANLADEGLRDVRNSVESCIDGLRRLCANLRPAPLEYLGLTASIRKLLHDVSARTSADVSCEVSGRERRLDQDAELAVFRVVQEALANVEKHGHASRVWAHIAYAKSGVVVAIRDDGVGFDLGTRAVKGTGAGEHLGILGMEERARLAGGETEIQSQPGEGPSVTVSVPERAPFEVG